jgi:hypothetical protein
MHYVTRIAHRIKKNKFCVMCPSAHFVESLPVPPEQEKWCVDILCPVDTEKHYVTHRFHQM